MSKKIEKTPFEQALAEVMNGKLKAPSVSSNGHQVPYFRYQLSVHKFNLSIMSSGMTCRGIKLKDLKGYYGLKGRTAKDCLPQLLKIIEDYEANLVISN